MPNPIKSAEYISVHKLGILLGRGEEGVMLDTATLQLRLRQTMEADRPRHSVPLSVFADRVGRRLRICRLGQRDLEPLCAMYRSFGPDQRSFGLPPRRPEQVGAWLETLFHRDVQLIAKAGARVVAHAAWVRDTPRRAEVLVFVHPDFQGAGLGRKMLAAVIVLARFMAVRSLWAEVENRNVPMIHVNGALGFHTVARHLGSREMEIEP